MKLKSRLIRARLVLAANLLAVHSKSKLKLRTYWLERLYSLSGESILSSF